MPKRILLPALLLAGIATPPNVLFASEKAPPEEGTIVLRAVDVDTGEPLKGVDIMCENPAGEDWCEWTGATGPDGTVERRTLPRRSYFYEITPPYPHYKVAGLDSAPEAPFVEGRREHTFYLRKRDYEIEGLPDVLPLPEGRRLEFAVPEELRGKSRLLRAEVNDMPGFEKQPVTFTILPRGEHAPNQKHFDLAEHIYHNGRRVRAAIRDELLYFQKAEGAKAGDIEKVKGVMIEIDPSPRQSKTISWVLWCRTEGGLQLKQKGFKIRFVDLKSWDLQVPAYLHPAF